MTPTPAQIDAAAEAILAKAIELLPQDVDQIPVSKKRCRQYAEIALTAAAEVGEQGIEYWKRIAMKAEEDANAMARDARVKQMSDSPRWDAALVALERNHTIERCAQVADGFMDTNDAPLIAAAIRALKDKP